MGGHDDLVYEEIKLAAQAVMRGAELIGATRDPNFPMPDGPWPGTGAVLAAIEVAVRPHGLARRRQARGGHVRRRAATASATAARSASATASTSTSRAPAAPAWTPRSC